MVRLEKLLYERVANVKALGRQRIFGAPRKWFNEEKNAECQTAAHILFDTGLKASIFRLLEPIISYFFWKWPREILLNKGLAMEDIMVHQDRELRREMLFENIQRQSCHPYQHLMFKRRRARFFKVDRAVKGFVVPDYVRKEAESRLLADTADVKFEYESFVYNNYYSDMTPTARYTAMHRLIPLEIFNVYGLFREEAWERYFMNEVETDVYSKEVTERAKNPFSQYNLETDEGKRAFEAEVNRFIDLYPGTIVREGEQFNFKEYYAKYAILTGKDTSRFDTKFVEEMKHQLENEKGVSSLALPSKKVGKSVLGTEFPARLASKYHKVLL